MEKNTVTLNWDFLRVTSVEPGWRNTIVTKLWVGRTWCDGVIHSAGQREQGSIISRSELEMEEEEGKEELP